MYEDEYPAPVSRLLSLGWDPQRREWPDYIREYGLEPPHVGVLLRMVADERFLYSEEENAAAWAPVHAWRALGQLRAVAAIPVLINLLHTLDDDWADGEIPRVLGMIGPAAITALATYLADGTHDEGPRWLAAESLKEIGLRHPAGRGRCIAVLHRQLGQYTDQPDGLNGLLIALLCDLDAVGALPTIAAVYAAGRVDEMVIGWDNVVADLGETAARLDAIVDGRAKSA